MREEYQFLRDGARDAMNKMRSNSLFWEFRNRAPVTSDYIPLYTTKPDDIVRDGVTYYSLKKIYMSYEHVPGYEYDFAMDVFGSWEHWVFLSKESMVKDMIQEWQEELNVKIKAAAIKNIIEISKGNSTSASLANKWVADKGWEVKAGRPTKAEKQRQLKEDSRVRDSLKEDMERLGLQVVGSK